MSTSAYPPGGTFFDTLKRSFVDVPVDTANNNAISTTEFLEASESLVTLFDVLGTVAFNPVKSDMNGNVKKIRTQQLAAPAESTTLQGLITNEKATGKKTDAYDGLLWLNRGLDFTCQALQQNMKNTSDELSKSFRGSYEKTLMPHHRFYVKPVFNAAMSATPYRKDFYVKLGEDQGKVNEELEKWLTSLAAVVTVLNGFFEALAKEEEAKKGKK